MLLLDTLVLLAILRSRFDRLDEGVRAALTRPDAELVVSVVSIWEIAIKARLGKLRVEFALARLPELVCGMPAKLLPIRAEHVLTEVDPRPQTRDPFDRLLLAQCQTENLRLVTQDRQLVGHRLAGTTAS